MGNDGEQRGAMRNDKVVHFARPSGRMQREQRGTMTAGLETMGNDGEQRGRTGSVQNASRGSLRASESESDARGDLKNAGRGVRSVLPRGRQSLSQSQSQTRA